jgi:hypothetical protein
MQTIASVASKVFISETTFVCQFVHLVLFMTSAGQITCAKIVHKNARHVSQQNSVLSAKSNTFFAKEVIQLTRIMLSRVVCWNVLRVFIYHKRIVDARSATNHAEPA